MNILYAILGLFYLSSLVASGPSEDLTIEILKNLHPNKIRQIERECTSSNIWSIVRSQSPYGIQLNDGSKKFFQESVYEKTAHNIISFNNFDYLIDHLIKESPEILINYVINYIDHIIDTNKDESTIFKQLNDFLESEVIQKLYNKAPKGHAFIENLSFLLLDFEVINELNFLAKSLLYQAVFDKIKPPQFIFECIVGLDMALLFSGSEYKISPNIWNITSSKVYNEFDLHFNENHFRNFKSQVYSPFYEADATIIGEYANYKFSYQDLGHFRQRIYHYFSKNFKQLLNDNAKASLGNFNYRRIVKQDKSMKLQVKYSLIIHYIGSLILRHSDSFLSIQEDFVNFIKDRYPYNHVTNNLLFQQIEQDPNLFSKIRKQLYQLENLDIN